MGRGQLGKAGSSHIYTNRADRDLRQYSAEGVEGKLEGQPEDSIVNVDQGDRSELNRTMEGEKVGTVGTSFVDKETGDLNCSSGPSGGKGLDHEPRQEKNAKKTWGRTR